MKHKDSIKNIGDLANSNAAVSPLLGTLKEQPGVSPQLLPIGNIGSLINGSNPNGIMLGGAANSKRKLTEHDPLKGSNIPTDLAGLADDLYY